MATMSPEVETDKNVNSSDKSTNSENKQTTFANVSGTEDKSTSTISQNLENTKSAKPATDEEENSRLAINHFLSIIVFLQCLLRSF